MKMTEFVTETVLKWTTPRVQKGVLLTLPKHEHSEDLKFIAHTLTALARAERCDDQVKAGNGYYQVSEYKVPSDINLYKVVNFSHRVGQSEYALRAQGIGSMVTAEIDYTFDQEYVVRPSELEAIFDMFGKNDKDFKFSMGALTKKFMEIGDVTACYVTDGRFIRNFLEARPGAIAVEVCQILGLTSQYGCWGPETVQESHRELVRWCTMGAGSSEEV